MGLPKAKVDWTQAKIDYLSGDERSPTAFMRAYGGLTEAYLGNGSFKKHIRGWMDEWDQMQKDKLENAKQKVAEFVMSEEQLLKIKFKILTNLNNFLAEDDTIKNRADKISIIEQLRMLEKIKIELGEPNTIIKSETTLNDNREEKAKLSDRINAGFDEIQQRLNKNA